MHEKFGRTQSITLKTVLPLTLVLGLLSATWGLASDRQQAMQRITVVEKAAEKSEREQAAIRERLDSLTQSMIRIEAALGTSPDGSKKK